MKGGEHFWTRKDEKSECRAGLLRFPFRGFKHRGDPGQGTTIQLRGGIELGRSAGGVVPEGAERVPSSEVLSQEDSMLGEKEVVKARMYFITQRSGKSWGDEEPEVSSRPASVADHDSRRSNSVEPAAF